MIHQGDVWWADLDEPVGSTAGYRRPVVVVQCDAINQSQLATVVCVPLTSNLKWAAAPGNVLIRAKASGLTKDSVASCIQMFAVDKAQLVQRAGHLARKDMDRLMTGIDAVLGR